MEKSIYSRKKRSAKTFKREKHLDLITMKEIIKKAEPLKSSFSKSLMEGYYERLLHPEKGRRIKIADLVKKSEKYKKPTKMNEYDEIIYKV